VWDLSLAGWGADWYGDAATSFFAPLFSGPPSYPPIGSNYGFYNNAKTNSIIQQAQTAPTRGQSDPLWGQADRQVMQDAAIFPITNPKWPAYHATQVKNTVFIPAFQNFDPANVWLDPSTNGG
jgi:peptide/nickel transport system substrate-binding protein